MARPVRLSYGPEQNAAVRPLLISEGDVRKACLRYGFKNADEFNKAKKELQSAIGYLDQRMTNGTFTKHTPAAAKLPVQARKPQRADIVEKNTSAAATGSVPKPSSKKPVSLTNPTLPDARESSSSSIGSSASVKRGTVVREDGSGISWKIQMLVAID